MGRWWGSAHQHGDVSAREAGRALGEASQLARVQVMRRRAEVDAEQLGARLGLGQGDVDAPLEAPPHLPRVVVGVVVGVEAGVGVTVRLGFRVGPRRHRTAGSSAHGTLVAASTSTPSAASDMRTSSSFFRRRVVSFSPSVRAEASASTWWLKVKNPQLWGGRSRAAEATVSFQDARAALWGA